MKPVSVLALVLVLGSGAVRADDAVELRGGVDSAFVAEVDYAHSIGPVVLDGELDVPWDTPDFGDWRIRAGISVPLGERWRVVPRIAPTVRASSNTSANLVGIGADLSVVAGYVGRRWFAGGELGFDAEVATHVTPSASFKMTVFPGAAGWYSALGGIARAGVVTGTTFGANQLELRIGPTFGTLLPAYATLGYARRF